MPNREEMEVIADDLLIDATDLSDEQLEAAIAEARSEDDVETISNEKAAAEAKAADAAKAEKAKAAEAKKQADAKVDEQGDASEGNKLEVEIVRGYTPEDKSDIMPGYNKLMPGQVVDMEAKLAKKLIKAGIATFPDDEDDLGDE